MLIVTYHTLCKLINAANTQDSDEFDELLNDYIIQLIDRFFSWFFWYIKMNLFEYLILCMDTEVLTIPENLD